MIMEKVKGGKFSFSNEEWNVVSMEAKMMITKMLQRGNTIVYKFPDPNKRCSAEEALKDIWIQKNTTLPNIDEPTLTRALNNMKTFHVIIIFYYFKADKKLQEAIWIVIVNNLAT